MTQVKKSGTPQSVKPVTPEDLALINRFTLAPLEADDVFCFDVNACDTQVDRTYERFSPAALEKLAELFVGRTVIFDHAWSASAQTARIYRAQVTHEGDVARLRVSVYMLNNDSTADLRKAICGGILKEVSVGCAVSRAVCSICGQDYGRCAHSAGETYGGTLCTVILEDPTDAYELSFVAVPAQREAAVTKAAGISLDKSDQDIERDASKEAYSKQLAQAKARVDLCHKLINL